MDNAVIQIRKRVGSRNKMGRICGVSGNAIKKWEKAGHLPRTDWCGLTSYARRIADFLGDPQVQYELLRKTPGSVEG